MIKFKTKNYAKLDFFFLHKSFEIWAVLIEANSSSKIAAEGKFFFRGNPQNFDTTDHSETTNLEFFIASEKNVSNSSHFKILKPC